MKTILRTSILTLATVTAAIGGAQAEDNGRGGGSGYAGGGDHFSRARVPNDRQRRIVYVKGEGYCEHVIHRGGEPLVFLYPCDDRR